MIMQIHNMAGLKDTYSRFARAASSERREASQSCFYWYDEDNRLEIIPDKPAGCDHLVNMVLAL